MSSSLLFLFLFFVGGFSLFCGKYFDITYITCFNLTVEGSISETHLGSDLIPESVPVPFCIYIKNINFCSKKIFFTFHSVHCAPATGSASGVVCCFMYTNNMAMTCLHLPPLVVPLGQEQLEPIILPAHSQSNIIVHFDCTRALLPELNTLHFNL